MIMSRQIAREAALAGDRAAMTYYAQMCLEGIGGPSDDRQAIMWFQCAAEAGDPIGMHNFALLCLKGAGVPKDIKKAQHFYEEAAYWGYVPSMCELSALFMRHPELPDAETFSMFWMKAAFDEDEEYADAICYQKPGMEQYQRNARWIFDQMHEYNELFELVAKPPAKE